MRRWVCSLQLLLALAIAVILRSDSRGTHDHILLSQIRDSPNLESHVPLVISPRNRVAQLYPPALGSVFVPRRANVEVFEPASTREPTGSPQLSSRQLLGTDYIENTVSNSNSIAVCVFVAAGTCLPIRCLETGCVTPLFIRLLHNNGCTRYICHVEVFA
jgi:hypothetical protein